MRAPVLPLLCILLALAAPSRAGTTVNELARIQGQGELELRGVGLVVGLPRSGDSGKELAVARPLQQLYINSGNPVVIDDVRGATSVALVSVSCRVPETGARAGDRI